MQVSKHTLYNLADVIHMSESPGQPQEPSPSIRAARMLQKGCAQITGPLLSLDTRSYL